MQQNPLTGPTTTAFAHIVTATSLVPQRGGVVVVQGGTYAGKTYAIMQLLALLAAKDAGCVITVAGQSIPHLKRGAYHDFQTIWMRSELMRKFFPESGWNKSERKFIATNGSVIHFDSYDLHKAHGSKRTHLFLNEGNGIPVEVYDQLKTRTDGLTFIDHNPSAAYWAHDVATHPGAKLIVLTHRQNEFCSEEKRAEIESWRSSNPQKYRVYGLGKTGQVEGLVFKWNKARVPESARIAGYGLDFGYHPDPTAALAVYRDGQNVYLKELIYERGLTPSELAKRVKQVCTEPVTIWADGARPDLIRELASYGLNIRAAEKGSGSILWGVQVMQEFALSITPESLSLDMELLDYFWPKNDIGQSVQGNPIGKADHLIDAARYCISMTLANKHVSGPPVPRQNTRHTGF